MNAKMAAQQASMAPQQQVMPATYNQQPMQPMQPSAYPPQGMPATYTAAPQQQPTQLPSGMVCFGLDIGLRQNDLTCCSPIA
jgi:hypothetical protein